MATKKKTILNEQKFIKTEYGKKLYKNMIIWTIIFIIGIALEAILFSIGNDTTDLIAAIMTYINGLIFAISLFNDGKYQGALEIYNKRLK